MIQESLRDVLRTHLLESKEWPAAPKELSPKQLSKLSILRKQLQDRGKSMVAFTLEQYPGKLFVEAPGLSSKMVYMEPDGSGGTVKDPFMFARIRDDPGQGTILKHIDDIEQDKKDAERRKEMGKKAKEAKIGVYVQKGLPSSAQYKWDGKNWYRWDGYARKWFRHTKKKGHPTASDLTNDMSLGRLEKQK